MSKRTHILRAAAWIAGAALYGMFTAVNAELICRALVSLAGSLALLAAHPSLAVSVSDAALIEYWVAVTLWCGVPVAAAARMLRMPRTESPSPMRARFISRGVLTAFVLAALCAPIIAPLPPLAQGDLLHTRFLPPLSVGFSETSVPEVPEEREPAFALHAVRNANMYLLHRSVYFSGINDAGALPSADVAASIQPAPRTRVAFLFGTDAVGRDVFSRVVYGARYSIGIGFIVVLFSISIGSCIGMVAGYHGGLADSVVMRVVDVLMAVPTLFLVLALMAILGQSVAAMIIVLTATEWMGIARIVRGEVIHLRGREFIAASRLLGTPALGIMRMHIVPNVRPAILDAAALQLGNIFLAEASLSFLGLGIQAPNPSWGNMIAESMGHLNAGMSAGIFPGAALSALIAAVHLMGTTEH